MPSTPQTLTAELRQQVEEMKRAQEAWEKDEHEREEVLLRAVEEEETWQVEAALEVEQEYRAQGWRLDELLEEFQWHQRREKKQKEVDMEDQGPCLGCWSRKMECIRE